MSYLKISFAFLIPILLFSASSLLMKPSQEETTKASVATTEVFETPVVNADAGPACKCYYEVTITSGGPVSTSAFRVRPAGGGTWVDYPYYNTNHYFGQLTVSAPYNYDFAVKSSSACSGSVQIACCNRPTVTYSGSLSSAIVASNYNTGGCNTTCDPPF